MTPRELYGRFALAEAVTWTLLILGMVLKYTGVSEAFVPVFGMLHGVVFLGYCVVTCFVWVDQRWSAGFGALGLASAVVPWATIPFERRAERTGRLAGGWRLAPGGDRPGTVLERLEAWSLRSPWLAVAAGAVVVAGLTSVLLYLGPPVPRG
jgi:integral membrane protein